MNPSVIALWERYRAINSNAPAEVPISFHFCDNREDADICAALVETGQKCATAPSVAELELAGDPIPKVGDYAIVTDWAGNAKAIIQTTSVEIRRFGDVDGDFAHAEGEGDLTIDWWRKAHQTYYQSVLAGHGYTVDSNLEIVCERFDLILRG